MPTLVVEDDFREQARSVILEVGGQDVDQKGTDDVHVAAGDVAVAEVFAHHRGVLGFDQSIVIGASRARLR